MNLSGGSFSPSARLVQLKQQRSKGFGFHVRLSVSERQVGVRGERLSPRRCTACERSAQQI